MKTSNSSEPRGPELSSAFKLGAVSLAFLILGYQICLFINHSAVNAIVAHRDKPDTVIVAVRGDIPPAGSEPETGSQAPSAPDILTGSESRIVSDHSGRAREIYLNSPSRCVESFDFNPNTVSRDELVRLGFSDKQAASILNYREKGGVFRRKSDFARSYVVADSVYLRLEPYIKIPLIDINLADSAEFDTLPGIGGWFASRMVSYREELGGYSNIEQLMDIYHFDREKFDALKDLICCDNPAPPFQLWTLPAEELQKHPCIRSYKTAKAIVLYRENNRPEALTVSGLKEAGILSEQQAECLSRCAIARPDCISQTAP